MKSIVICDMHQGSCPTPLIDTFAFRGAELWCPYCGTPIGMFDGGTKVDSTPELEQRLAKFEQASKQMLDARSKLICSKLMYNGKEISPSELPAEERSRLQQIATSWKLFQKIEELI